MDLWQKNNIMPCLLDLTQQNMRSKCSLPENMWIIGNVRVVSRTFGKLYLLFDQIFWVRSCNNQCASRSFHDPFPPSPVGVARIDLMSGLAGYSFMAVEAISPGIASARRSHRSPGTRVGSEKFITMRSPEIEWKPPIY